MPIDDDLTALRGVLELLKQHGQCTTEITVGRISLKLAPVVTDEQRQERTKRFKSSIPTLADYIARAQSEFDAEQREEAGVS